MGNYKVVVSAENKGKCTKSSKRPFFLQKMENALNCLFLPPEIYECQVLNKINQILLVINTNTIVQRNKEFLSFFLYLMFYDDV